MAGACGSPEPTGDAGTPVDDVLFEAVADPSERTDCAGEAPGIEEARAKHVTCDAELPEGALAMGRIGDIVIENAHARFVIRTGTESASTIGGPAGGIVDAAPRGGSDFVKEILPLLELQSIRPSEIAIVDAGGDDEARVRVLFEDAPIGLVETVVPGLARPVRARGRLDYVLRAGESALRLEIALTPSVGVANGVARAGMLALLGGQEEVQPGWGLLEGDAIGGEGRVVVAEREDGALAIALESEPASLLHVGTIHLLQGTRLVYARGATVGYQAEVAVGADAAEAYAAIADPALAPLTITGGGRVEIAREGRIVLRTRVPEGGASIPLAPGTYALRAGFDGFFEDRTQSVEHGASATSFAVDPAPAATLRIAASVETDPLAPVRVTVERGGEELLRFVAMGPTERRLPPGDARVSISHGLEHDVSQDDVVLVSGATLELAPVLARVIDSTGWASVDLHLHSEASTDSVHRLEDALRMIAAEGLDVVSSTDHDFVTDYPGLAARAGIEGRVLLVAGEEVSTTVFGHVNGYPLARDPDRAGAGAVVWFDRAPLEIFDALRERGDTSVGGALVQVNHPRLDRGFFDAIGLDPATGHATADPAVLDLPAETDLDDLAFDVIEVWNGYTRGDNEESFEDYLALFAAGRRFAMVGNSDTHRPDLPAGSPRSFVRVPDDTRGAFGWEDVAASLRAHDVTVAGGIFVTAELAGARGGGTVPVHVRVQAAPWIVTDRLRIYAGRAVVVDQVIAAGSAPLRLEQTIDVPIGSESFVVVRADGATEPAPFQHFAPFGVTNAIVVP